MHDRARGREDLLRAENERLRAQLRLCQQQLFGRKTEAGNAATPAAKPPQSPPRRAHVRRDFLSVARTWPEQETWALSRVERIGALYRLNDARLAVREDDERFAVADGRLREAVTAFGEQGAAELAEASLHPARHKVLESLGDHWAGLTVFVEHPEVPMDNNTAERAERGPVVGRKNYYGSGAVWAGRLAALLFSVLQTLCLWRLDPRAWLTLRSPSSMSKA